MRAEEKAAEGVNEAVNVGEVARDAVE